MRCKRKRRIVALLTNYPSDHYRFTGGVETATAALLEGLEKYQSEYEFHVVSLSKSSSKDVHEQRNGFSFHFLGIPRYRWLRPRLPFRVVKAYRVLKRIEPDLIHCQGNIALAVAAILSGYRRIFTAHGLLKDEAHKRTGWEFWSSSVEALIEKYVHRHFDAYIFNSSYAAGVIGEKRSAFNIPNPVRSLFFDIHIDRTSERKPYFLFVGAQAPLKRPMDLLLAHAELRRQIRCLETIFCGEMEDAGYVRSMQKMIAQRKIQGARFLGHVSQEGLVDLLKGAVALVLPSAQENSPMVIAEAMAVGVPVLATRVGGIPEMVAHGHTGLLFNSGDVSELVDCLKRLLADTSLQHQLGKNAKEVARSIYSPMQVAERTSRIYRQFLDGLPADGNQ
jgi:glycosyltransferase involved in cell wall biosynthesis